MTTAIVHGCRGIHLRMLDFSLMCGNGGEASPEGLYRCPPLLLNWGPSLEMENVDILSRIHSIVRMLTGKGLDSPDFIASLIDDDYTAMSSLEASNAVCSRGPGWVLDMDNRSLNFLALENNSSGDILLMVVADSEGSHDCILFPGRRGDDYEPVHIAGEEAFASAGSHTELSLCYSGMPRYTASLYLLRCKK